MKLFFFICNFQIKKKYLCIFRRFYIRFPFVNISDCIEFESGEMYVYNENEKYELNIKSRWKETEIDWIDYGDILLDLRELKVGHSSLNLQ